MIPISDTAYPQFKTRYTEAELVRGYTPTANELALCDQCTKGDATRLGFMLLLKTFQRLGYFVATTVIPAAIIAHVADNLAETVIRTRLNRYDDSRARKKHIRAIRAYLQVKPFSQGGDVVLQQALKETALVKEDLADIINVGLETLVRHRFELPAFSKLVREARRQRKAAYTTFCQHIVDGLNETGRQFLDQLLVTDPARRLSPWQDLKQDTSQPSIQVLHALLIRYARLVDLSRYDDLLQPIPRVKREQLALEARSLDVTSLADIEPLRRYTLMLALIYRQRRQVTDDLCEVFIKQMNRIRHKAKADLDQYLEDNQAKTDEVLSRYAQCDAVLDSDDADSDQLRKIRTLVKTRPDLGEFSRTHAEFGGKSEARFMRRYFKPRRAALLNILSTLPFAVTHQDTSLLDAIRFLLAHRTAKASWLPVTGLKRRGNDDPVALSDLFWIPEVWRKLVTGAVDKHRLPEKINRHQFEICLCLHVVNALKAGDLCVIGSDAYSDYRQELLPLDECAATLAKYGEQVGLPVAADAFVDHLKVLLSQRAQHADNRYPDNDYFEIRDGQPHLKRLTRRSKPDEFDLLDQALNRQLDRLDLTLLDVLTDTMKWLRWGRFFGPLSGYQRKITEEAKRYILTVFAYGAGLGPTQTARTTPGITARQIAFINQRHITAEKLDAAIREVLNAYSRFELPRFWGDGRHAAADGTPWQIYENNLLSEYHIRYGQFGGIAYYVVSDTYIALFSHFIPCGVYEAVYLLDGLMKNTSEIEPEVMHGDTQAQNLPAFALAFLLGIKLMPRIRNWQDLRFYKATAEHDYDYINDLFTHERINWALIARHLPDLFQIAQSIKAGLIAPSTILRRLGTGARRGRLYFAFRELGRVVRTLSLLEYLSDVELQRLVNTNTNKCELFNKFAKWAYFGSDVIQENVRDEQVKIIKYNHLIANLIIFHNAYSMTKILNDLERKGFRLSSELLGGLSPYRVEHLSRFGLYELRDREVDDISYELLLKTFDKEKRVRIEGQ